VTVRARTKSAVTDANGNYTLSELGPKQHAVTPALAGYAFIPPSQNVTVPPDKTSIDFSGYAAFSVDGTITQATNGAPSTNVLVSLLTNGTDVAFTTRTATNGTYSFTNLARGT